MAVRFIVHSFCYNEVSKRKENNIMNIIWYLFVCGSFFGSAYVISKNKENKRLRARLNAMEEPIDRQFINMAA